MDKDINIVKWEIVNQNPSDTTYRAKVDKGTLYKVVDGKNMAITFAPDKQSK